ncbi:hypothetical protein [Streptomyces sp. NPDC060366]|uniref:hypothetical protein n=1 Tax=Streptomyces sp. NPDC060366 TaxID=3347105 RepID=UPI003668CBC4
MSPRRYEAASVRQLGVVVDQLAGEVSGERMRQLRMVVGMWDRAVIRHEMGGRSLRRAQQFFTRPVLEIFWDLAAAGELRHWDKDVGTLMPVASLRIVRDCLAIMAREVVPERRVWLPSVPEVELKDTVEPDRVDSLYWKLVEMAAAGPLERDGTALSYEDRTRLLALVAVVLDAAPRSGELAAMRLTDIAAGERAVRVRRQQQKGAPNRYEEIAALAEVHPSSVKEVMLGRLDQRSEFTRQRVLAAVEELGPPAEEEWYALRPASRAALRHWLRVRGSLEGPPLTSRSTQPPLWVTLVPTKAGPAGVTIAAQGLRMAYARGMTALNFVMSGREGWRPLPMRMEQLRRSVTVTPLEGPPG